MIRQKVCPLCDGNGRWDDIECLLCDTRGYIELRDEDDAPALTSSSSGQGAYQGRPDAAARVGNGSAPDRAGPLLTSDGPFAVRQPV